MTHAKFYLNSYARSIDRTLQQPKTSKTSSNSLMNNWIRIDGSESKRNLSLVYNGEVDELTVNYRNCKEESLKLPNEAITLKVFLKDKTALFLITGAEFRRFKVRFISEKSANDFFNLMTSVIEIERTDPMDRTEDKTEADNAVALNPDDNSLQIEFEQNIHKAVTFASSQASQLTQPNSSTSFVNGHSEFTVNDSTLNEYVQQCLSDPDFPAFVQRVQQAAASTLMMNRFN